MDTIKKQKLLILLSCILYACAWLGKYNYNANIIPVLEFYGVTRADAGFVGTAFFFSYGTFQFLHACFCRFYPKRTVIAMALLLSAAINLVLFFRPPFASILFLWILNGFCQAALWPTLLLTLGETLAPERMGQAVMALSFSVLLGNIFIYGGSALFNMGNTFQAIFLLSAILMLLVGVVWFFTFRVLVGEGSTGRTKEIAKKTERPKRRPIRLALVGLLTICALVVIPNNFIKDGLNTWLPTILKEQFAFKSSVSIVVTFAFSVFGMLGSAFALRMNKWIRNFRVLIGFFFLLLTLFVGGAAFSLRETLLIPFLICVGCCAAMVFATLNTLTSIMPLAMRDQVNSGFLTGLMNSCACVGSAISTYTFGRIADRAGWNAVFQILFFAAAASALLVGVTVFIHLFNSKKDPTGRPPDGGAAWKRT